MKAKASTVRHTSIRSDVLSMFIHYSNKMRTLPQRTTFSLRVYVCVWRFVFTTTDDGMALRHTNLRFANVQIFRPKWCKSNFGLPNRRVSPSMHSLNSWCSVCSHFLSRITFIIAMQTKEKKQFTRIKVEHSRTKTVQRNLVVAVFSRFFRLPSNKW